MSEFRTVSAIVHEERFEFFLVMHQELPKAVRQNELGFLIVSIADLRHGSVAPELSAHAVVNTVRHTPTGRHTFELVTLETLELGMVLFHLRQSPQRHHHPYLLPLAC